MPWRAEFPDRTLRLRRRKRRGDVGGRDVQLEHASYFFMITGESSTDHFMTTGQSTAVSGVTMGVYLFRNATG